jgi:subtilisin family serine protease
MHGSNVTGIAAAIPANNLGFTGAAWNTPVDVYKVANNDGGMLVSWITAAVNYAANSIPNTKVINISLGFPCGDYNASGTLISYPTGCDTNLETAITNANNKGIIVVAAAGNSGNQNVYLTGDNVGQYGCTPLSTTCARNPIMWPAGYSKVLSVAATQSSGAIADFSTFNAGVNIAAPGVDIGVISPVDAWSSNNTYTTGSGTSYASPIVASAAALLKRMSPS